MPLADLQRQIRNAVINRDGEPVATLLVGGILPSKRLDIHLRHYETSLTAAVVGRFPATGWLLGPKRLEEAARRFVHTSPPTSPCIAEYGSGFPAFLATWPDTAPLAYMPAFADLDWHLGRLAVSVDTAPVTAKQLAHIAPDDLTAMAVSFQAGTHYLKADWAVDTLIKLYLTGVRPESWTLGDEEVHLEVRGARGTFQFSRLNAPDYAFRASLAEGHSLGRAAADALELEKEFDPGSALLALLRERLMTSIGRSDAGGRS